MKYKGYNIGKLSKSLYGGKDDKYYWNVNFNQRNVHFETLREAKEYINKQLSKI